MRTSGPSPAAPDGSERNRVESGPAPAGPGRLRLILWAAVSFLIAYWFVGQIFPDAGEPRQISYTRFREHLDEGQLERVRVRGERIQGHLSTRAFAVAEGDSVEYEAFTTYLPSFGDDELLQDLRGRGVEIETEREAEGNWWSILIALSPILLLVFFGLMIARGMRAQGKNMLDIGRSRAKLYEQRAERTTFDDVGGAEGAKAELRELVQYLERPSRFQALGAAVPKGVLLVGPPGTGKTLLARAVAGEANVPFFIITGSDFMEMFVGVGARRVRDLFQKAKRVAPSIVFIDELDSIGRHRGAGLGGGHDEREQTLNQMLSELDGFEASENVIVMGATNRPDILDPALLRPGRFDRHIMVDLPSARERAEILRLHARSKPMADGVDMDAIARSTPGFSGADLENLLNEGAFAAAREREDRIGAVHLEEARDRVLMGLERQGMALSDEQVRLLAYHEGGHTLVSAVLPRADPVHKVTIVPRGRSMGSTHQLPEDETYVYERAAMLDRLSVMLGGRAAERVALDTVTSGSEDDLRQATSLARKMVFDWGMSDRMGPMVSGRQQQQVFLGEQMGQAREYSEETARILDEEVRAVLDEAWDRAVDVLESHREVLDRIAETLIAEERMTGADVERLLEDAGVTR